MINLKLFCAALTLLALGSVLPTAHAQDKLKIAAGQRGNWDTSIAEIGQLGGIFKKHNLALEILYTQGGGETQQAVISGSVDIGVAAGIMGVLSASSKGAPVRIIGAETTGAADLFWYAAATSPIKSLKDTDRETIAWMYSDPSALKVYADFVGISEAIAKRTRDGFFPKESINPDRIVGLDTIVNDAVSFKYTTAPLTKDQLSELIQIPPRT